MHTTTKAASTILALGAVLATAPTAAATSLYLSGTQQPGPYVPTSQSEGDYFTGDPNAVVVQYDHSIFGPVVGKGSLYLGPSIQTGVTALRPLVQSGDTVVGVSQGAVVAQEVKEQLNADPNGPTNVTFITYGDPSNTDGGILAKLHGLGVSLPSVLPTYAADDDTRFNTTTVAIQYEGIADAPDNLLDVVADANAVLGAVYLHPTYNTADLTKPGNIVTTTVNSEGGVNTHILVPTAQLPLTQPLRNLGINTSGLDKVLRPIIDAGYNRPAAHKPALHASRAPKPGHTGKGH